MIGLQMNNSPDTGNRKDKGTFYKILPLLAGVSTYIVANIVGIVPKEWSLLPKASGEGVFGMVFVK
jgi:hypothetical protein